MEVHRERLVCSFTGAQLEELSRQCYANCVRAVELAGRCGPCGVGAVVCGGGGLTNARRSLGVNEEACRATGCAAGLAVFMPARREMTD